MSKSIAQHIAHTLAPHEEIQLAFVFGSAASGTLRPDSDADGLPDAREYFVYGTNPNDSDTDGDGMNDGDEAAQGFDPAVFNASATVWIRFPENGRRMP